ncbi:hypothetical protein [Streptomyces sparsogenes]|uniref:hypothetical protein n=1 Tax=Streptomyces sparsogenes TaxID=67365 RepID=UPI003F4CEFBE
MAVVRTVRQLLALGLTVQDIQQIADRLPQLVEISLEDCAGIDFSDPAADIIDRRLTAIDAEIARLTRLRDTLTAQPALRLMALHPDVPNAREPRDGAGG